MLRHPKWIIVLLIAVTGLAVGQMRNLQLETDLEAMLPKDLDAYVNKYVLEERFGAEDMVVIGILNDTPEGVYNTAYVEAG